MQLNLPDDEDGVTKTLFQLMTLTRCFVCILIATVGIGCGTVDPGSSSNSTLPSQLDTQSSIERLHREAIGNQIY
ncbi:MAG: hypothetical protein AAF236_13125 [Verrucomicrobiota bacterium]